ncbi:MAG: hypothetical protein E7475_06960 [Ruminococcaceae bacterium]|nr:hypothetical protein [Oscillospiraceae bacterium]
MTKEAAIHKFLSGFGLDAYAATAVPKDAELPCLTYELSTSAWGDGEAPITVNLWYYGGTEAEPNAKAQELSDAIRLGGVLLSCDGGSVWLKRGSPFCQNLSDASDANVKRRYINLSAEYLTIS